MIKTLLPVGIRDLESPYANFKHQSLQNIMDLCTDIGFHRIHPPLIEFDRGGDGFKIIDPIDGALLSIRDDMTIQMMRYAKKRKGIQYLCYGGDVLIPKPGALDPLRQRTQYGVEIIGCSQQQIRDCLMQTIAVAGNIISRWNLSEISLIIRDPQRQDNDLDHRKTDAIHQDLEYKSDIDNLCQQYFHHITVHQDNYSKNTVPYHKKIAFEVFDNTSQKLLIRGGVYQIDDAWGVGFSGWLSPLLAEKAIKHSGTELSPNTNIETFLRGLK